MHWAVEVVSWADAQGIDLTADAELFPYVPIVLWARAQRQAPDVERICFRWGVSRATGYRWHELLARSHREYHAARARHRSEACGRVPADGMAHA